jgi:hypothetical protein
LQADAGFADDAIACLEGGIDRMFELKKDLDDAYYDARQKTPLEYVTVSPALSQQKQDYHYWQQSQAALLTAQRDTKAAEAKFFASCDWEADQEAAAVLSATAGFPTPIIAGILQFANSKSAVFCDFSLHAFLLRSERHSKKRKRCT